jgi:hypothetical protein
MPRPLSWPEFYQSGADDSEFYGYEPEEDNDMSTDSPEVFCLKGQLDRANILIEGIKQQLRLILKGVDEEESLQIIREMIEFHENNEKGGS